VIDKQGDIREVADQSEAGNARRQTASAAPAQTSWVGVLEFWGERREEKRGKVWGAIAPEVNVDQISGKKRGRVASSSRDSIRLIVCRVLTNDHRRSGSWCVKACPHCRRKVRLSPLSRRFLRLSHFSATVWTGLYRPLIGWRLPGSLLPASLSLVWTSLFIPHRKINSRPTL